MQAVLRRIKTKLDLRIPLSSSEVELVRHVTQLSKYNKRVKYVVDGDKMIVEKIADAEPIINYVKYRSDLLRCAPYKGPQRYLGSIDPVTAAQYSKECGHPIGTAGFNDYAVKKIQGEHTKFKADF